MGPLYAIGNLNPNDSERRHWSNVKLYGTVQPRCNLDSLVELKLYDDAGNVRSLGAKRAQLDLPMWFQQETGRSGEKRRRISRAKL